MSASYEQILIKFFGGVGRAHRTNRLDFGGDPDQYLDTGFLDPNQDPDPEIFNGFTDKFFGWVGVVQITIN